MSFYDDYKNVTAAISARIGRASELTGRSRAVVGVGGVESLVVAMAAKDALGKQNVLAVIAHSMFSNSTLPPKLSEALDWQGIEYATMDSTEISLSYLGTGVELHRIERDKLYYAMTDHQKQSLLEIARAAVVAGLAIKCDSMNLGAIGHDKIVKGFGAVEAHLFDFNPAMEFTRQQHLRVLAARNVPDHILEIKAGLDLRADGGPFFDESDAGVYNQKFGVGKHDWRMDDESY
jgi:NH3-dependent NAD+ synthetase